MKVLPHAQQMIILKAQMDFLIGQTYLTQGQANQAYPYFLDTVSKYPLSYDSYSALVSLVDAGVPVDDFERGLVDYFAGQYGVALDAFNRYLINHPEHDGTVLHFLALIMRRKWRVSTSYRQLDKTN